MHVWAVVNKDVDTCLRKTSNCNFIDKPFHIPLNFPRDFSQMEWRLWIATGLFPTFNNLAYFATEDGGFIIIKRILSDVIVELWDTQPGEKQSHVYSMAGPQQRIALLRSDQFDPKKRP